jgi:hypothetical protein
VPIQTSNFLRRGRREVVVEVEGEVVVLEWDQVVREACQEISVVQGMKARLWILVVARILF